MIALTGLIVAIVSLLISGLTAWLTLMRRGTVLMTQPTVIYFGPDGGREEGKFQEKVYLRTLLYATSRRGRIISGMFLRVRRGETSQNFSIWVHGDARSRTGLFRGSGLFVPDTGVSADHHFLLPSDARFEFLSGRYSLEIFAMLVGDKRPKRLFLTELNVDSREAEKLKEHQYGLYFDWGPDALRYEPHLKFHNEAKLRESFVNAITKSLE